MLSLVWLTFLLLCSSSVHSRENEIHYGRDFIDSMFPVSSIDYNGNPQPKMDLALLENIFGGVVGGIGSTIIETVLAKVLSTAAMMFKDIEIRYSESLPWWSNATIPLVPEAFQNVACFANRIIDNLATGLTDIIISRLDNGDCKFCSFSFHFSTCSRFFLQ